jgi:hypothetical protein
LLDPRGGGRRHNARQVPGIGEEKEDLLDRERNPLHEFKPVGHAFFIGARLLSTEMLRAQAK